MRKEEGDDNSEESESIDPDKKELKYSAIKLKSFWYASTEF